MAILVIFGELLSRDSPVEGSVNCAFCHGIPLFKASFIGPSGPPGGIRERSERALTLVCPHAVLLRTSRNFWLAHMLAPARGLSFHFHSDDTPDEMVRR